MPETRRKSADIEGNFTDNTEFLLCNVRALESGPDPGPVVGGGANPSEGGAILNFGLYGARARSAPLRSASGNDWSKLLKTKGYIPKWLTGNQITDAENRSKYKIKDRPR